MTYAYISIGNTDGKLSPAQWDDFRDTAHTVIYGVVDQVHGSWHSFIPEYVNACWCVEVSGNREKNLKAALRRLASEFGQEWIAYAPATLERIEP